MCRLLFLLLFCYHAAWPPPCCGQERFASTQGYTSIAFFAGGTRLAACSCTDSITIWELAHGKRVSSLKADGTFQRRLAMSADGQVLFSLGSCAYENRALYHWDVRSRRGELFARKIHSLALSTDGKRLATGGTDGVVRIWEAPAWKETAAFKAGKYVLSLDFSPKNGFLVVGVDADPGAQEHTLILWEVGSRKEKWRRRSSGRVLSVATAPDGSIAFTGERIQLVDITSKERLPRLRGDFLSLAHVAFSPDGKLLATGDGERIRIWDLHTPTAKHTMLERGFISEIRFSQDGRLVAASTIDSLKVWSLSDLAKGNGGSNSAEPKVSTPFGTSSTSSAGQAAPETWKGGEEEKGAALGDLILRADWKNANTRFRR